MRSMFSHWKYNLIVCLLLLLEWCECEDDGLLVVSVAGSMRGVRAQDGPYKMFLGIPYANVNKSNVFGDSIPAAPFQEEYKAYTISNSCPQYLDYEPQSLDCLQLNIYVPESVRSPVPVMVYIHGGGGIIGSATDWTPKYLVRHDVILITFNYRLGAYGLFCLDTPEVPGNAGLKDQVLALRWIRNNIRSFGGDPQRVTLFGHSSGSYMAALHLLSETETLFSNIILMGLTELNPVLNPMDGRNSSPLMLAELLNYKPADLSDALAFLSTVESRVLATTAHNAGMQFRPCVEKHFPGVERFLGQLPVNANYSKCKGIAVLAGYTTDESLFSYVMSYWPPPQKYPLIAFDLEEQEYRELGDIVRQFYESNDETNSESIKQYYIDWSSDVYVVFPMTRSINRYLEAGADKVYQYVLSYDGGRNFVKLNLNITHLPGVTHGDELGYLFDIAIAPEVVSAEDQLVLDRITAMWTNFAKYGDPTPRVDPLLPVRWRAVTRDSPRHYINVGVNMTAGTDHRSQVIAFHKMLYKAYGRYERGLNTSTPADRPPRAPHAPRPASVVCTTIGSIAATIVVYIILTEITTFLTQS